MVKYVSALMSVIVLGAGAAHAANLIKDASFETPATPAGTFTTYAPGQTIGQWIVVGPGNVATVNNYQEGGVLWTAHQGHAFLDLTGTCDCGAASGVAQTVKTVPGTSYKLTFWVGNTVIGGQGNTSTVDVYNGSTRLIAATNKAGSGSFVNGDPSGDEQNGLDAITLISD